MCLMFAPMIPCTKAFLDPALIIRSVHMIPDFGGDRVSDLLLQWSLMRSERDDKSEDGLE